MEKVINTIWEYWKMVCGIGCVVIPLLIMVFGGEIKIQITWHSIVDLWNQIKK